MEGRQKHRSTYLFVMLERLRQPAYTGENRCVPCTVLNIVLAGGVCALLAFVSPVVAGIVFVLALATIYLRGYLVPGTPRLTKRYLPGWLLRRFDKATVETGASAEQETDIDPEAVLRRAGALTECTDHDDLCLNERFRSVLYGQIETKRDAAEDLSKSEITGMLAADTDGISLDERDDGFVARIDNRTVGQWPSHAAIIADSAAATLLARRDSGWNHRSPAERSRLLAALRLFLDTCPTCSGALALGEETVESCCRSIEVVAVSCEDCDAKIFEIDHVAEIADE